LPVLDDLIAWCQPEHTEAIIQHIQDLFGFYRSHGLVYLEINPFVFDASGQIVNLDMVVKVDTCELYRQSTQWKPIHWVKPFGTTSHPAEDYIESLDAKTWASLKLTIINPQGTIWFLLGGWGASVIAMDTLINAWLGSHIANYGELSGNPDADSNKAYIQTIIDCMIANDAPTQYLCLVWGIANFTNILALAKPLAELIHINAHILIQKNIHIVVRRGWINDIQAQNLIQSTCDQYMIPCTIMSVDKDLCAFIRPVQ
jgi:succinyl-CoA synthetase beta subunit